MKLAVEEAESPALRRVLAPATDAAASVLVAVEVPRAVARAGGGESGRRSAAEALAGMTLLELTEPIRERAAALDPPTLRSLDAIHVATALELGDELDFLVTYDARLREAARAHGLDVQAPS